MDSGISIFSSKSRRSQDASNPPNGPFVQRKRSALVPPPATQASRTENTRNGSVPTSATMPSQPASRAASTAMQASQTQYTGNGSVPTSATVPSQPTSRAAFLTIEPTASKAAPGAPSLISLKTALGPAQAVPSTVPSVISLKTALGTAPETTPFTDPKDPGEESSTTSSISNISPTDNRRRPHCPKRTLLIGISGAPASGKTSLALLLSLLLPSARPVFVIHQDEYRVPKHLRVPTSDDEPHDNARDAVDFSTFRKLLQYAKREGQLPTAFETTHDEPTERERAETLLREEEWKALRTFAAKNMNLNPACTLGIVEGPLLFHDPEIRELLDARLFLWASVEVARTRWLDTIACGNPKVEGVPSWLTQDHFDRIIWRNHVEETRHLFHRGDVAGVAHLRVCNELGIRVQPRMDSTLSETMRWAMDMVVNDLDDCGSEAARSRYRRRGSSGEVPEAGWRGAVERLRCVLYKLV